MSIQQLDKYTKEHVATIRDVLFVFWSVIRQYKISFFSILCLAVVGGAIQASIPLYYKQLFDLIGVAELSALQGVLVSILILQLSFWLIYRGNVYILQVFESHVIKGLKNHAFGYLLYHSHTFFANNFTGSLTTKVNRLSRGFERIFDKITFKVIPLIIYVAVTCYVLFGIKPWLSLVVIVLLCMYFGLNYAFSIFKIKYDIEAIKAESLTTGVLSDNITNHNAIAHFAAEKYEQQNYHNVTEDYRVKVLKLWNVRAYFDAAQALGIVVMEFVILYFALGLLSQGSITLGTFILIQTYFLALGSKLWDLSSIIRDFYEGFADGKEMVDLLLQPHDIQDTAEARTREKDLQVEHGEIVFDDVVFAFNETRDVVKHLSLRIAPGEKVALVGLSGAGKSTIVRLMMRLYDVTSGEIRIDGQNIAHVRQASVRHAISLVPQESILFHRSLMENIRYGRRNATDAEVIEAAKHAFCHDFISALPLGYETLVGERGIKLSGGERQRIAIARAILKNAPVLIFDEATSSLDSQSEHHIQSAMKTLMAGKTTIVIAHRLSTIKQMDRIIVLKDGGVAEQGTHESLLAQPHSAYAHLWKLQAGGFV